ncbi:MAG: HTTM domain-containing protein [Armatimonadetes bacterium]|nr:HTTM domain-containing protein [Armatimonadota bacterium]
MKQILNMLRAGAGVDLRSLALLRIGYALLLLGDLADRAQDLAAHYSDLGVLPRSALLELFSESYYWICLHAISGTWQFQAFLFLLQAGFAVVLLVGYKTRPMTFLCWLLLISLHCRNPMVLTAGDIIFRVIFFWALFLPWGARWSVDAALQPGLRKLPDRYVALPGLALLCQVAFIYWFAVLHKTGKEWMSDGSAVYYALQIDQLVTPAGQYLGTFYALTVALTLAVYWFQILAPCLLFSPVANGPLRTVAVFGFVAMHLGFAMCLGLGIFPWIAICTVLGVLPSWFWERLGARWSRHRLEELPARLANRLGLAEESEKPIPVQPGPAGNLLVAALLVYVLAWNIDTITPRQVMPVGLHWIGYLVRIDQEWDMFSPHPLVDDGWYVIEARLADGRQVDLYRDGAELCWEKPARVASTFRNGRWRKYMMNLWWAVLEPHRLHYSRYLCRTWNASHPPDEQLTSFRIYFMLEKTRLNYEPTEPVKRLLWTHWCLDRPPERRPTRGYRQAGGVSPRCR